MAIISMRSTILLWFHNPQAPRRTCTYDCMTCVHPKLYSALAMFVIIQQWIMATPQYKKAEHPCRSQQDGPYPTGVSFTHTRINYCHMRQDYFWFTLHVFHA